MAILGLSVPAFTTLHVIISLIGLLAGIVFVGGLLAGRWLSSWNIVFLVTTILTSATGFLFHSKMFGPPHIVGVISLVILLAAVVALRAGWRRSYVAAAVAALYLNAFVAVVQAFDKIAPLHALAPTGGGPVFGAAQLVVLIAFIAIGVMADRGLAVRAGSAEGA
jgi:hypothetical protein